MKNIIMITIFAAALFLAACGGGGGGGEPSLLVGSEGGNGGLVGGGFVGGGGSVPVENALSLPSAGTEVYETAASLRSNNGKIRIDKNGKIIGMYGVPFNPCKNKPCKEETEAPETTRP